MAKPIDHMEAAGTITLLRVMAWVCALAAGAAAVALLVYGGESNDPPFIEAAAIAASGFLSWLLLSVFAYVAQCVGRIAMHAERAERPSEAPTGEEVDGGL